MTPSHGTFSFACRRVCNGSFSTRRWNRWNVGSCFAGCGNAKRYPDSGTNFGNTNSGTDNTYAGTDERNSDLGTDHACSYGNVDSDSDR